MSGAGPFHERPLSAYMYFAKERRGSVERALAEEHGRAPLFTEVGKALGKAWSRLAEADRAPFAERAAEAKRAYEAWVVRAAGLSRPRPKSRLRAEPAAEPCAEPEAELRARLRAELEAELRAKLRAELRAELETDLWAELEADIKAGLATDG